MARDTDKETKGKTEETRKPAKGTRKSNVGSEGEAENLVKWHTVASDRGGGGVSGRIDAAEAQCYRNIG